MTSVSYEQPASTDRRHVTNKNVGHITGSAVALHCCKAHLKINMKMENSTPYKIVSPKNFILKLGTRDYVENITH